jgi:hypothetical protein
LPFRGAGHLFITIVPVTTDLLTVLDENRKGIQIELRKWLPGTVQDRRSGLKKKELANINKY